MSSVEYGSATEGGLGSADAGVADVVINDARIVRVPIEEVDEPLVRVSVACRDHRRVRK